MRLIVGITGATGAIYGVRLLERLRDAGVETHLVISRWGARTLLHETPYTREQVEACAREGVQAMQKRRYLVVPGILNREVVDEIISVGDEDAIAMSRRLTHDEGLLVGISAGANVFAALKIAKRLGQGKRVVTVLPDTGDRYLTMEL